MALDRITLEGQFVRLEPLAGLHWDGLTEAINDGDLWKLFFTSVPHPDKVDEFITEADLAHERGDTLAFATIDKATNKVAGSTRFMRASLEDKRIEIGFTFLGSSYQRTRINTEAKLLMLTHAFDTLGLNRVEFLTDYLNQRSRDAILRLGAKQEGILRSHRVMSDGRVRDTVVFSILRNEWDGVRRNLVHKLT